MSILSERIAQAGGLDQFHERGNVALNFFDPAITSPFEIYQHPLQYLLWISPARVEMMADAKAVIQPQYFELLEKYGFDDDELFDKSKMFNMMLQTNPGVESVMFNDLYKIANEFEKTFVNEQHEGFREQLYLQSLKYGIESVPAFLQPVVEQYIADNPQLQNSPPGVVPENPKRGGGLGLLTLAGLALSLLS